MDINKAKELGLKLLKEHNLEDWILRFDNCKRRFGQCRPVEEVISMSKLIVELNTEAEFVDTVKHEIAHALVGCRHNHDYVWKDKAVAIGCSGERTYSEDVIIPKGEYIMTCPNCKKVSTRHKIPRENSACGRCCKKYNNGKWHKDYVYTWRRE